MFTRSIPAFIDGSLFRAPCVSEEVDQRRTAPDIEKGEDTPVGDCSCSLANGGTKPF